MEAVIVKNEGVSHTKAQYQSTKHTQMHMPSASTLYGFEKVRKAVKREQNTSLQHAATNARKLTIQSLLWPS